MAKGWLEWRVIPKDWADRAVLRHRVCGSTKLQLDEQDRSCHAIRRDGQHCQGRAMKGSNYCRAHGGKAWRKRYDKQIRADG